VEDSGWTSLFNGRDLAGWVVEQGAVCLATNGNLRVVGGDGWLRSTGQYTDFVFEAEWRALQPQYNSGFFIRAGTVGKPWPDGVWQVDLASSSLGALVKGSTTMVPAETPRMPLNKWVKFRIEVRGAKVSLDVDGERAWEFDKLDAARGYLGIQAEGKTFEFRNLRVMELPAGSGAPAK